VVRAVPALPLPMVKNGEKLKRVYAIHPPIKMGGLLATL